MLRTGAILLGLFCTALVLRSGPTAPVNPAERNDAFSPDQQTQGQKVSPASDQLRQPAVNPVKGGVDKKLAPAAGTEAAINKTPQAKAMVPMPTAPKMDARAPQSQQVFVIKGSTTLLRPQEHPVQSKAGSKFQKALNEARTASAERAEQYRKNAKMEKVNEFVPTAPAPADSTRAGSEPKSPAP